MSDEDDKNTENVKAVEDAGGNIVSNAVAEAAFTGAVEVVANVTKGLVEGSGELAEQAMKGLGEATSVAAEAAGSALEAAGDLAEGAAEIAGDVLSNIDIDSDL